MRTRHILRAQAVGLLVVFSCGEFSGPAESGGQGAIGGHVCDAADSSGLDSVRVRGIGLTERTFTDSTGYFCLAALPAGDSVLLHFERPHYSPRIAAVSVVSSDTVQLANVVYMSRDFGVLAGRVVDLCTQAPVPNADVRVRGNTDSTYVDSARTGSAGAFRITYLPPDSVGYRVEVSASGYDKTEALQTLADGDSVNLRVVLAGLVAVRGSVLESGSLAPIRGAAVRAGGDSATSDDLGVFHLSGMWVGDTGTLLTVSARYYDSAHVRDTLACSESALADIHLTRSRGALRVSAAVQGRSDHRGVVVALPQEGLVDTTDSLGFAWFSSVEAGLLEITMSHGDCRDYVDTIELLGNDTASVWAELILETGEIGTSVVWDLWRSPYHVRDTLKVAGNGQLNIQHGVTVFLHQAALIEVQNDGSVQASGTKSYRVRIEPAGESMAAAGIQIRATGEQDALSYTMVTNIPVSFRGGVRVGHSLFVRANRSDTSSLVTVDCDEFDCYFTNCDFVTINSPTPPTGLAGNPSCGKAHFTGCIFYQTTGGVLCNNFLTTDPSSIGFPVVVQSCDMYASCIPPVSLLSLVAADTTFVRQIDPQYVDIEALDFHLKDTSPLLGPGPIPYENHLGALGLPDPEEVLE